jgi:type IV pilus assembly protein PilM
MFFAKKACGIEITQDGLAMVQAEGKSASPVLDRYALAEFPPETVRVSFKEPNIINPEVFVKLVKESHLRLATSEKRVSLSLPDATGRVLVMDMETRFKNRAEGIDLIRWKLKKNFPLDISDVYLDYQILQYRETGEISVLVGLISTQVVSQYEELLQEAGLKPNRIDFSTLNVYRLLADRCDLSEQTAFITWFRGTVGVMVFANGVLDFYRHKEIVGAVSEPNRLFREVNSSLLVYHDKRAGQPLQKVFYASSPDDRAVMQRVVSEAVGLEPLYLDIDPIMHRSREKVDSQTFGKLLVALAAATRNM